MINKVRTNVPDRMKCVNLRMVIDDRRVNTNLDYHETETGCIPMAVWSRVRPNESTLDRELRAEGKMTSLLLQYGCSLKEVAETLGKDSIIGAVTNYLHKNIIDILNDVNNPKVDKVPRLSTDPYRIK